MNDVTVVIPAYNCSHLLARCLDGPGLALEGGKPRMIVVDNGSSDNTGEVAAAMGVEVLEATRPGPASARNIGLALADTEYVAFLDADSVPEEGWLTNLLDGIRFRKWVGAGGHIRWVSPDPFLQRFHRRHYPGNEQCSTPEPPSYVLTSNAIFNRAALAGAGGFDPKFNWCEDLELGLRLAQNGATFGYVPKAVVSQSVPESALDHFSQFYKYGFGHELVQPLYPEDLDWWTPESAWLEILELAKAVVLEDNRREHTMLLLTRLAYAAGWTDARGRRKLRGLTSPSADVLPHVQHRLRSLRHEKCVALSIDDGPSGATTEQLLRILDEHDASATFFVNGARAERHPQLIRQMLDAGHEVFGHGYTHRRLDCMSGPEIRSEMEQTESVLREMRPTPSPYLVRLPYGFGARDAHVIKALRKWNAACLIVQWSLALDDWEINTRCETPEQVESECAKTAFRVLDEDNLAGSILLLHDEPLGAKGNYIAEVSITLLAQVLKILDELGFRVTTIGDEMNRDEVTSSLAEAIS